ncbi:MAG TPA: glycosyltransferase family 87 protein [Planctomycetaceae bacterium]|nr:glycosyltransferase family 87 protein [Planctomycetaceae bacterium]
MADPSLFAHVRRHWAVFLGISIALAVWCAVDVSRRAIIDPAHPGRHMTDLTVYTEAGRAFFDGREPYEVANIRGWKYLYPPLLALVVAPLARLSGPAQAGVWFGLSALMGFGIYFECCKLLKRSLPFKNCHADDSYGVAGPGDSGNALVPLPIWLIVAAATAAILPALNCLQRGQMGVALLYFLLLGYRLTVTGRSVRIWLMGGAFLSLPIALKLTPLLPVACLLFALFISAAANRSRARDNRQFSHAACATVGCIAGCVFFLVLFPGALVGWNDNLRHLTTWYEKVATKVNDVRTEDFGGDVDSPRNQSFSNAVYRCGNWAAYQLGGGPYDNLTGKAHQAMPMDAPAVSRALFVVRGLAVAALLCVVVRAARSKSPLLWGAAFGLASVATLVVSPVARGHYFVLLLPASLFMPLWLIETGRPSVARRAAIVPAVLIAAHYCLLEYAGRVGLLGIGTTLWYFAACTRIIWETVRRASLPPFAGGSRGGVLRLDSCPDRASPAVSETKTPSRLSPWTES